MSSASYFSWSFSSLVSLPLPIPRPSPPAAVVYQRNARERRSRSRGGQLFLVGGFLVGFPSVRGHRTPPPPAGVSLMESLRVACGVTLSHIGRGSRSKSGKWAGKGSGIARPQLSFVRTFKNPGNDLVPPSVLGDVVQTVAVSAGVFPS